MFDELYNLARISTARAKLLLTEHGGKLNETQREDVEKMLQAAINLSALTEKYREVLSMRYPPRHPDKQFIQMIHLIRGAIVALRGWAIMTAEYSPDTCNEYQLAQLTKIEAATALSKQRFIDWVHFSELPVPTLTIPTLFSIANIITSVVQNEKAWMRNKEASPAQVTLQIEDNLPMIYGYDPSRIEIFIKSILWGFNFSPLDTVTVSAQCVYAGTSQQRVEVRVSKPYDDDCSNLDWLVLSDRYREVLTGPDFTVKVLGSRRFWLQCHGGMITFFAQFETHPAQKRRTQHFNIPRRTVRVLDEANYHRINRYFSILIERRFVGRNEFLC